MDDFCGVDRLQPPSAGRRDGPRLAVRADSQHLGGDQLDLLAGPLDSRAHPQITLGGNTAEQVDHDPAQPRVVALLTPFQPAHQQSRYGCGVLYRGGPRAAHHVRREKLFAEFVCCIEQFVIRVTHGRPAPGMSTVVASRRDSFVPTSRCGYALVLESMNSVRRYGPPSVQAIAVRSPMLMRSVTVPPSTIRSNWWASVIDTQTPPSVSRQMLLAARRARRRRFAARIATHSRRWRTRSTGDRRTRRPSAFCRRE